MTDIKTYAIDFETEYSDEYSVADIGAVNYVLDPRFCAYLVAIHGEEFSWAGEPEDAPWEMLDGQRVIAHNVVFEICCCMRLQGDGIIPADWAPAEWHCTMDLTRYLGLSQRVGLQYLAKVALGRTLSKDPRAHAKGMTREDFKADPVEWKDICDYCIGDSIVCYDAWMKYQHLWPENERRVAWQTRQVELAGIPVDRELIAVSRETLNVKREECLDSMPWYPENKPMSIAAFKETCSLYGLECPKSTAQTDIEFQQFKNENVNNFPWITAIGDLRKANRMEKILAKMERFTSPLNMCHVGYKYHGAHTGRWSGKEVNIQNPNKDAVFGVNLRAATKARDGKVFVIYDYAQIEPRTTFWLAGDRAFLDLVRTGMSPYEAHARLSMGWTGGKLKTENPKMYAFAKARVIGLGYGMGGDRFYGECKKNGLDTVKEEAHATVKEYRSGNPCIPKLWKSLESQLKSMIGQKSGSFMLPSGRPLRFYHIRTVAVHKFDKMMDQLYASYYLNDRRGHSTWGGTLTENVVQAIARDVIAEACLRIEDCWDLLASFTSHDESIYEVELDVTPEVEALLNKGYSLEPVEGGYQYFDKDLKELIFLEDEGMTRTWATRIEEGMIELPEWATGLPLEVEGMITKVYTK